MRSVESRLLSVVTFSSTLRNKRLCYVESPPPKTPRRTPARPEAEVEAKLTKDKLELAEAEYDLAQAKVEGKPTDGLNSKIAALKAAPQPLHQQLGALSRVQREWGGAADG